MFFSEFLIIFLIFLVYNRDAMHTPEFTLPKKLLSCYWMNIWIDYGLAKIIDDSVAGWELYNWTSCAIKPIAQAMWAVIQICINLCCCPCFRRWRMILRPIVHAVCNDTILYCYLCFCIQYMMHCCRYHVWDVSRWFRFVLGRLYLLFWWDVSRTSNTLCLCVLCHLIALAVKRFPVNWQKLGVPSWLARAGAQWWIIEKPFHFQSVVSPGKGSKQMKYWGIFDKNRIYFSS